MYLTLSLLWSSVWFRTEADQRSQDDGGLHPDVRAMCLCHQRRGNAVE